MFYLALLLLTLVGCTTPTPTPTIELFNCDPRKDQCWSVDEDLLKDFIILREQSIILKRTIRACQERL